MPSPRATALADEIKALSPPDKLRLAAGLLERKKPELALKIAHDVVAELGAELMLRDYEKASRQ